MPIQGRLLSARFTRAFCACFRASGSERCAQQQPWLPQGLAAATVPGIVSAVGMADSGLALFESLSYRTFSVGENGFTWTGSRFDRPAPEHRELRLLLPVFVGGWYIAIADVGLRSTQPNLQVLRQAQGEWLG